MLAFNNNEMINQIRIGEKISTLFLFIVLSIPAIFKGGIDTNSIYYLLVFGLGGILIFYKEIQNQVSAIHQVSVYLFGIYIFWSILSIFWSINILRSIIEIFHILLVLYVLVATIMLKEEAIDKTIMVVLLVASSISFIGILEYILLNQTRISSTFDNPNPFGTYLGMLFLLSFSFMRRKNIRAYIIIPVLLLTTLLLSGSRGAILAVIVSIPFIFIHNDNRKNWLKVTISLLFTVLLSYMFYSLLVYLTPVIQKNLSVDMSILEQLLRKDSLFGSSSLGRIEFWKTSLNVFKTRPIFGYGLGTFFNSYHIGNIGFEWYSRFTHNHYLQILAELGIVGFIIFMSFIISVFYKIFSLIKNDNLTLLKASVIPAIFCFFSHIFIEFSWNFTAVTIITFWLIGILLHPQGLESDKPVNNLLIIDLRPIVSVILIILLIHSTSILIYSKSMELIANKDYISAGKILRVANTVYPINQNGFMLEGNVFIDDYTKTRNPESLSKAIELTEKALLLAPYDFNTHVYASDIYKLTGNKMKVEEHLISAIDLTTHSIKRHLGLASFYIDIKNYEKAEDVLIRATSIEDFAMQDYRSNPELGIFDKSQIHALMFYLYKTTSESRKMERQSKIMLNMAKEHEIMKDWYNIEMFEINLRSDL